MSGDFVETLASLAARRPLKVEEALAVMRDVANALAALHKQGRTHGAVCGENVVLDPEGLASLVPASAPGPNASPEELQGREPDVRSDIYALGATIGAAVDRSAPLPEPFARLLAMMTSPDPLSRPGSVDEVLLGVDACELMCGRQAFRPGKEQEVVRARRLLLPLVVLVLGLLVLGAAVLALLRPAAPPRGEPPDSFAGLIEKASSGPGAP